MRNLLFICTVVLLCLTGIHVNGQNRTSRITATSPDKLYLGSLIDKNSVNAEHLATLTNLSGDIHISYSIPRAHSRLIKPTREALYQALTNELLQLGAPVQQQNSFTHTIREFTSYKSLEPLFGQSLNRQTWFGTEQDSVHAKTSLVINLERTAFSVDMDLPTHQPVASDPAAIAGTKSEDLLYVNTISFGRRVVVLVQSALEKAVVQPVLQLALQKKNLTEEQQYILANCSLTIIQLGTDTIDMNSDNPLSDVVDYLSEDLDSNNFGMPISFGALYFKDNSVYENYF